MAEIDLNAVINSSKIPDPIKFLPSFDGETKTLHHWLTAAQDVLALYEDVRVAAPAVYRVWIGVIRSKIVAKANEALVSRNIPNDWDAIRLNLIEHFGDRRDLSTLCQKIPYMKQGQKSIDTFHKEVTELSANINQKILLDIRYDGHADAVMTFVREITKNAFIDGLNEPYNLTVRGSRPQTLEDAKSAADEQFQSVLRSRHYEGRAQSSKVAGFAQNFSRAPSQPRIPNNFQRPAQQNQIFAPRFNNSNVNQNAGNYRPNAQRSFSNVSPMEVDPSMRSRQSVQPMSISQRSRNNQIANVEHVEESQEDLQVEDDFPVESSDDFANGPADGELNFHLAVDHQPTG